MNSSSGTLTRYSYADREELDRGISSVAMLIRAYGVFWRASEVDWKPGTGGGRRFELLGHRGSNRGSLESADFRTQHGLYVLYDQYGPYYVGLARADSLGYRLRSHATKDAHVGMWDRFSWFGFRKVLSGVDQRGVQLLSKSAERARGPVADAIADIEALVINALGPKANARNMKFQLSGKEWLQVSRDDRDPLLNRLRS